MWNIYLVKKSERGKVVFPAFVVIVFLVEKNASERFFH